MAVPSTLLLSTLLSLLFHLLLPSAANEGNIIVTGDILHTDNQLNVPNAVFVIQNDCNLVLYNKGSGFQSNTSGSGSKCTVTLSEYGQLQVRNVEGTVIWSSGCSGPRGEYAAILQPNGQVGIYGPSIWSTRHFTIFNADDSTVEGNKIINEPNVPNMLFSSEVLNENSKLVSRDYSLEVKEGCTLEFTKASKDILWSSPKKNLGGQHCFLRLNFHGQLSLIDDYYRTMWVSTTTIPATSMPMKPDGVYVLVVKINGEAVIYGSRIWST